jgi:hypothetical protein
MLIERVFFNLMGLFSTMNSQAEFSSNNVSFNQNITKTEQIILHRAAVYS